MLKLKWKDKTDMIVVKIDRLQLSISTDSGNWFASCVPFFKNTPLKAKNAENAKLEAIGGLRRRLSRIVDLLYDS